MNGLYLFLIIKNIIFFLFDNIYEEKYVQVTIFSQIQISEQEKGKGKPNKESNLT